MIHRSARRVLTLMAVGAALAATATVAAGCMTSEASGDDADETRNAAEAVGTAEEAVTSGPTCQASAGGKYCGNDFIANGVASTLYSCPGGVGAAASVFSTCPSGCYVAPAGQSDYCVSPPDSCSNSTNCNNCVYYAKCRKPTLPGGLGDFAGKKAIINTYVAQVGAVAIIDTGNTVGHVAYVEAVNGTTITLAEGNWPYGSCGHRSNTAANLKIVGYFK